ncbi:MAG: hypothetical protein RDU25_04220 [Patescibacteria group bacterium]|nr:hypothetical protein [Patescibacteria group bacterium]
MPEKFPAPPSEHSPQQSDESKTMQQLGEIAFSESSDSFSADVAHQSLMMGHHANEAESRRIQRESYKKNEGTETKK